MSLLLRLITEKVRYLTMALMLAAATAATASDVEVTLDLYHFTGNLTVEQRDALLASPGWQVKAGYLPVISVPWVTASWSKCGFLSLPCLQDDTEEIALPGSAIHSQGTQLHFSVPLHVGLRRFRLAYINLRLPLPGGYTVPDLSVDIYTNTNDGVSTSPVVLKSGTFLIAGTLRMRGGIFQARYDCPDRQQCWEKTENGRYAFRPSHRFGFYNQSYLFPDPAQPIRQPLPAELAHSTIYDATRHTHQVDGHRIELIDISANESRENCSSNDRQYEILFVDGEAITFSQTFPDPDPTLCCSHHRHIEWGNDGKPLTFGGMRVESTNRGSSVTYFNWNSGCRSVVAGNTSECNTPAPTPTREDEFRSEATRVRKWFLDR